MKNRLRIVVVPTLRGKLKTMVSQDGMSKASRMLFVRVRIISDSTQRLRRPSAGDRHGTDTRLTRRVAVFER